MGSRWYRIPSVPIALHVWHRLGIRVREHEFVRIEHGEIQAIAVFDRRTHCCEFWLVDEIGAQTLDRQKLSVHGIHMRMTVEQTAVRVLADGNNRASGNAACVVVPVGSGLQH